MATAYPASLSRCGDMRVAAGVLTQPVDADDGGLGRPSWCPPCRMQGRAIGGVQGEGLFSHGGIIPHGA